MAGTITHSWNGTVLTITSDSGTSSCDLKGEKGDDGARGAQGQPGGTCYAIGQAAYNILDNTDFANSINQRGATSYTGTAYGIDRWYGRVAAQTTQVRSTDLTITATGTAYVGLRQKIEKMAKYAGKTLTFACRLYATAVPTIGFYTGEGTLLSSQRGTAGHTQTIVLTYTIPADATTDSDIPSIILQNKVSGDYMRLYWAALYEGEYTVDSLPAYQPKGKAAELAECQRYYKQYIATASTYSFVGNGYITGSGKDVVIGVPANMRIKPTITVNGSIGIRDANGYVVDLEGYANPVATATGGWACDWASIYFRKTDSTGWGGTNNALCSVCLLYDTTMALSADL